jgi:LPS-assembly lipoprotein
MPITNMTIECNYGVNRRRTTCVLFASVCLLLSGCGFHLSGVGEQQQFPQSLSTLRVRQENVQDNALKVEMERALKTQARVQVVSSPLSTPVLTLYDERSETRAVSVDQNVRVSEFLITYHVSFDVKDASGKELVKRQGITLQRNFSFDKNAQLAMEREAQEIQARMRTDAVQQIMRRLAASKS